MPLVSDLIIFSIQSVWSVKFINCQNVVCNKVTHTILWWQRCVSTLLPQLLIIGQTKSKYLVWPTPNSLMHKMFANDHKNIFLRSTLANLWKDPIPYTCFSKNFQLHDSHQSVFQYRFLEILLQFISLQAFQRGNTYRTNYSTIVTVFWLNIAILNFDINPSKCL